MDLYKVVEDNFTIFNFKKKVLHKIRNKLNYDIRKIFIKYAFNLL